MSLEEYRTLFMTVGLVMIIGAAFPGISVVLPFPEGGERFSEFWLLGPERMAENYPFNVGAEEAQGPIYLGVGNHMGCSEYYMAYLKFRNQTQPLPDSRVSTPSPLPPLYEFRFFLEAGEVWEARLTFKVLDVLLQDDAMLVGNISINDVEFSVDCFSAWDSENRGFFYQLFFELWLYDRESQGFKYHNRFVGIWLNMTGSQ